MRSSLDSGLKMAIGEVQSSAPFTSMELAAETKPIDSLVDPKLREIFDYWQDCRASRRWPLRQDIRPEHIAKHLSRVSLVEVRRRPLAFVFRLAGNEDEGIYGISTKGRNLNEVMPPRFAAMLRDHYEMALMQHQPIYHEITLGWGEHQRELRRLLLPLSSDGTQLDLILSAGNWDLMRPSFADFLHGAKGL